MTEKNPFFGATFAERKAERLKSENLATKQVDDEVDEVEDKAVTKASRKRAAKKS